MTIKTEEELRKAVVEKVAELKAQLKELTDRELKKSLIPVHNHNVGTTVGQGTEDVPYGKLNPKGTAKAEIKKGWPKDEAENEENANNHKVLEDFVREKGGKVRPISPSSVKHSLETKKWGKLPGFQTGPTAGDARDRTEVARIQNAQQQLPQRNVRDVDGNPHALGTPAADAIVRMRAALHARGVWDKEKDNWYPKGHSKYHETRNTNDFTKQELASETKKAEKCMKCGNMHMSLDKCGEMKKSGSIFNRMKMGKAELVDEKGDKSSNSVNTPFQVKDDGKCSKKIEAEGSGGKVSKGKSVKKSELVKAKFEEKFSPQSKASYRSERNERSIETPSYAQERRFALTSGATPGASGDKVVGIPKKTFEPNVHPSAEPSFMFNRGTSNAGLSALLLEAQTKPVFKQYFKEQALNIHQKIKQGKPPPPVQSLKGVNVTKAEVPTAKPPSGVNMATHVPTSKPAKQAKMPTMKAEIKKGILTDAAKQADPVSASAAAMQDKKEAKVKLPSAAVHADRASNFSSALGGGFSPKGPVSSGLELDKPKFASPRAAGVTPRPGIFGKLGSK